MKSWAELGDFTCAIPECGSSTEGQPLCPKHWRRLRRETKIAVFRKGEYGKKALDLVIESFREGWPLSRARIVDSESNGEPVRMEGKPK